MNGSGFRNSFWIGSTCALLGALPVRAQCLQWQPGFDPRGIGGYVYDCAVHDDGTGPAIYFGGEFHSAGGAIAHRIARYDGSTWSPVGAGGPNGTVTTVASLDDGSGPALYVSGFFWAVGSVLADHIARWDGSSWTALGSGLDQDALAIVVYDDGSGPALYVGGNFTTAGGASASHVAKWDGTSWSQVGLGTDAAVYALAVYDDGSGPALFAGGDFSTAGGASADRIARWDGSTWTPLAGGGCDGSVLALCAFDGGSGPELFAGGRFTTAGSAGVDRIASWNGSSWSDPGGLTDTPFSAPEVQDLIVHDDGSGPALHVSGWFQTAGGVAASNIARWDGTAWSPLGSGIDLDVKNLAVFDEGSGPVLCAAGHFSTAGGEIVRSVALWDGSRWAPEPGVRGGVDDAVLAMTVADVGSGPALFVGGLFTAAVDASASHIAEWDGTNWSEPGGGMNGAVRAMTVYDDGSGPALFVGGDFTLAGGAGADHIAKWDGSTWSEPGGGLDGNVLALTVHDDGSGPALFAGGMFITAGGSSALRIAKWNGSTWSALGGGFGSAVLCLTSYGGGPGPALYAGTTWPGSYIARWNGSTWSNVAGGTNGAVRALTVFDDGAGLALFAGGSFNVATNGGGPVGTGNIAKWNGAAWSALAGGFMNAPVYALTVFDDGSRPALYAGGLFPNVGGVYAPYIARWSGTTWSGLGGGMDSQVLALAAFDTQADGTPDLYAGGSFALAGNVPSWHIAQWSGCGRTGTPLCFGDGSGAACPCGNSGSAGRGCQNSSGTGGALLTAAGTPSLGSDSLILTSAGERPTALSIFLQGDQQIPPVAYGDGLRCTGGHLIRLYVRNATGGVVYAPASGEPSISARSAAKGDPLFPGAIRVYQVYYRDPVSTYCPDPPGNTFNVSNAVRIDWLP